MDNQESVPSRSVTFTKGNKGGQQCHLEGYIYTYEKTSKNGNRQWRCKDMKGFTPTCKGRITTCGELATRSSPHCHPSSDIEVQVQTFLSSLKEDCCTDTTSNVIRKKLLDTPEVAFVPVSDVPRAWQQVKTTLAGLPSTQPFVTYFEATWMNGPYPHQIWNHYQAALNDEPRTNNFSEGSNYSLNVAVACNNPSPAVE